MSVWTITGEEIGRLQGRDTEFTALLKQNGENMQYGSAGAGTTTEFGLICWVR